MVGAPGAGKGTQAERLAERLDLPHISTGRLFRAAISSDSSLGATVRSYVEVGALVPDDVTVKMVTGRLDESDAAAGAILDGFPRTRIQAEALDGMPVMTGLPEIAALYIDVPTSALMARLTGRRICSVDDQHVYHKMARPPRAEGFCDIDGARLRQRDDDKPSTVQRRLDKQLPPMYEVIDYYHSAGTLYTVDGEQPADEVTAGLIAALESAGRANEA
jgi:adenylate kinase